MLPDLRSLRDCLVGANADDQAKFLDGLSRNALAAMPWIFDIWALPHQLPPEGGWRNWLLLGGRGAGKTRAGAEWVRSLVEGAKPTDEGRYRRIALIAETMDQAREIMVFGESGILACSPPDRRPKWIATRKMLEWPNGATAQIFSASEPEALRGPQFDAAWLDEFGKWKRAGDTWDMLQFGLRLGDDPRLLITTTPRPIEALIKLQNDPATVVSHAPTSANKVHLAREFLETLDAQYKGTHLGRQEIDGDMVMEVRGALFTDGMINSARIDEAPEKIDRVIIAIDPPVSHHKKSDECGIVVAGATYGDDPRHWRGFIVADLSVQGARPEDWAAKAVAAYHEFGADCIIAEVNQGGNMIETLLRQADPLIPFREVRATKNKSLRAEPVAALFSQERIKICGHFDKLENQMRLITPMGFEGQGSPDRLDAMVWAMSELLVNKPQYSQGPNLRFL